METYGVLVRCVGLKAGPAAAVPHGLKFAFHASSEPSICKTGGTCP